MFYCFGICQINVIKRSNYVSLATFPDISLYHNSKVDLIVYSYVQQIIINS